MKNFLLLLSLLLGLGGAIAQADATWTPFQTIYSDPPAGTIEISFAAGKFKYDGGGVMWNWKIRSTFNEPVSGEVRVVVTDPTDKTGLREALGGFKCAPQSEQTEGNRGGLFTIGTAVERSYLYSLKIGDRVVVENNKVKPPTPATQGGATGGGINPGVNEIEFPGAPKRGADGKPILGPDENFSPWRSLGAGGAQARVRRLGPKNANGQFEWGIEVRNTSPQTQKYTLSIAGSDKSREENLLLAGGEVYRGVFSTTSESQIQLQLTGATPTNFMDVPAPGAAKTAPVAPTAPVLDEKTRAAKLEALNQQLLSGLSEMDPTDPNASLVKMNALTEQMWALMEQDPDSDSKKLVSLLRQFSRADADSQTALLTQILALIMALSD